MSIQAVGWCLELEDPELKPASRLVLVAVCNYSDENAACFPSQKKLGKNTGMTARTVRSHLQILEDLGYITREHRQREDGSRTTDLIRVWSKPKGKNLPVGQGEDLDNPKGKNEQAKGKLSSPLNEPSLEPSLEPSPLSAPKGARKTYPADFEALWAAWDAYGTTIGVKGEAFPEWVKAAKHVPVGQMIDAVKSYCAKSRKKDSYTKHVYRWLKARGWEDEIGSTETGAPEMSLQELREDGYRKTGYWLDIWGNKPSGPAAAPGEGA